MLSVFWGIGEKDRGETTTGKRKTKKIRRRDATKFRRR